MPQAVRPQRGLWSLGMWGTPQHSEGKALCPAPFSGGWPSSPLSPLTLTGHRQLPAKKPTPPPHRLPSNSRRLRPSLGTCSVAWASAQERERGCAPLAPLCSARWKEPSRPPGLSGQKPAQWRGGRRGRCRQSYGACIAPSSSHLELNKKQVLSGWCGKEGQAVSGVGTQGQETAAQLAAPLDLIQQGTLWVLSLPNLHKQCPTLGPLAERLHCKDVFVATLSWDAWENPRVAFARCRGSLGEGSLLSRVTGGREPSPQCRS